MLMDAIKDVIKEQIEGVLRDRLSEVLSPALAESVASRIIADIFGAPPTKVEVDLAAAQSAEPLEIDLGVVRAAESPLEKAHKRRGRPPKKREPESEPRLDFVAQPDTSEAYSERDIDEDADPFA